LEDLARDLKLTCRVLRREPGFAALAVTILALGIGANVAVFGVVNTLLLRPLPFREPDRLAWFASNGGVGGLSSQTYSVSAYEEYRRHNRSFEDLTAYMPFFGSITYDLTGRGEPLPVMVVQVAGNFFPLLGVDPLLGRTFVANECKMGGPAAALLSFGFWQRQYAGDPGIVGRTISLNGQTVTVVGVMPSSFDFGSVFCPGTNVDVFMPAVMDFWRTWGNTLSIVGRLKPGVTAAQAQAESRLLFPRLRAMHSDWYTDYFSVIAPLKDHVTGRLRRSLVVLWGAVGLILLIVCVNLSNLQLARAGARRKELAVRRALGAGRARLIRQFLTESLVLSGAGAALGALIAWVVVSYIARQGSLALPLLNELRIDWATLGWSLFAGLSAGILFGIVPALRMSGGPLNEALTDSGAGLSVGKKHDRLRMGLVISEVALACLLVVGAGLLLRSFSRVLAVDLGFQPQHAAALKVEYADGGNILKRGVELQEMVRRVDAIAGVESAGISDMLPLDRNRSWGLNARGVNYPKDHDYSVFVYVVTPGYLRSMGMRLRRGRDISWQDTADREPVTIINEAAARLDWPGLDPLGRMAQGLSAKDTRVIGVVGDVRESALEDASSPQVYLPMMQSEPEGAELVVRSSVPIGVLAPSIMSTLRSHYAGQPATEFRPIEGIVDHTVSPRRFIVLLISVFAGLGLVLASLGIYGVISYSVVQRRQEIAIRMALGASPGRIQYDVAARTLRLTLAGIIFGAVAAMIGARLIVSLLYSTTPTDPETFLGTVTVIVTVAMLAGYIPARRASRVEPILALRGN
jgi:predicted permease